MKGKPKLKNAKTIAACDSMRWWMGYTSIHGLSHLKGSSNAFTKVIWALAFTAGVFMTSTSVVKVVMDYRKYEVRVV